MEAALPDDMKSEIALARMDENVKSILATVEQIKTSVEKAQCASSDATARATAAAQTAEEAKRIVDTAFVRIDEARDERQELVRFSEQLKGAGKSAVFIFGLFQALFMALLIWLFSSVSTLRETKAVLEFRVQQLETSRPK